MEQFGVSRQSVTDEIRQTISGTIYVDNHIVLKNIIH